MIDILSEICSFAMKSTFSLPKGKWVFATQNGYLLRSKQLSGKMYTTHYEEERDRERVKLLKNSSVAELFQKESRQLHYQE